MKIRYSKISKKITHGRVHIYFTPFSPEGLGPNHLRLLLESGSRIQGRPLSSLQVEKENRFEVIPEVDPGSVERYEKLY
jgi:hypothetical protein